MTEQRLIEILGWIWAAFGIYWLAAGFRSAKARTYEASFHRLSRLTLLLAVFVLLFWRRGAVGFLGHRFVPYVGGLAYIGLGCAIVGMGIAAWARMHLGQFWSDKVVLKVDHQLIRTGPYAHMRHPIYSGVLLGVAGTAVALGEWRGIIAFVLLVINYSIKAKREERMLARQFGNEFQVHQKQTGFLLPKFASRVYPW